MRRATKLIRKIVVGVVGALLLVIGIILIPLPGPGLLICVAGFFVLSLEFEWAEKHLDTAKAKLKKIIEKSKPKID